MKKAVFIAHFVIHESSISVWWVQYNECIDYFYDYWRWL